MSFNSKIILEVYACLDRGYIGVKRGSEEGVASPIDFLCKIEISKFCDMSNQRNNTRR